MGCSRVLRVAAALLAVSCSGGDDNDDASSLSGMSGGSGLDDGTGDDGGSDSGSDDAPGSGEGDDGGSSGDTAGDGTATDTDAVDETGDPGTPLSFATDIYGPIISMNCTCHTLDVSGGLNMPDATTAYDNLMMDTSNSGLDLVLPGDASMSYLIAKLEGTHVEFGGDTGMMPLGNMLLPEEVTAFSQWVNTGAMP